MKKRIIFTAVLVALLFPRTSANKETDNVAEKKPVASATTTKTNAILAKW